MSARIFVRLPVGQGDAWTAPAPVSSQDCADIEPRRFGTKEWIDVPPGPAPVLLGWSPRPGTWHQRPPEFQRHQQTRPLDAYTIAPLRLLRALRAAELERAPVPTSPQLERTRQDPNGDKGKR